ncbi:hypothetical protein [Clostridium sp. HBUAS56010]|uniref:hypothetical protein n=1 Tax=Clostridium sp. HBUAS56010 TaxID=2571127 RepID=UPI0011778A47|nr:hypothetical protein [Clostridium sp. HBUAS56010]
MTRKQTNILKRISKTNIYDYTNSDHSEKEIIHFLANRGFIHYESDLDNRKIRCCVIKEEGKTALHDQKMAYLHWFVPLAVSIFAAIGGYREELALLLQTIMKLWK